MDDPNKAPREDASKDVENAVADLARDRSSSKWDAGQVDGAPYLARDVAAPDFGKDNTAEDIVLVAVSDATDATVVENVVPEESLAAEPGPEQPGAEPSNGPEPGAEPSNGPEPGAEPSTGPEVGPEAGKEPGMEPGPEPPRDGGITDSLPTSNCTIFYGSNPAQGAAGQPPGAGTLGAFCLATCDDIDGWGCSNFDGRTISVNGTTVSCGAPVTKKNGYYVFRASAGLHSYASIYWWGPAASACPAPAGGVFP